MGAVSTFAGLAPPTLPGNVDNANATLGAFNDPAGIAASGSRVFVADWGNNAIREIGLGATPSLSTLVAGRPNLLTNPRAEDASAPTGIMGWTTSTGEWQPLSRGSQCSNSICGHPYDGTYWFWGGPVEDAYLHQRVVVASNPNIATGTQRYHFSALVRGNTEDQARVVLDCLRSNGTSCGILFDSDWMNPATWTPVEADVLPPTNTHRLRVRLETHATAGGSADAYFDSIQLRALRPTGAPSSDTDKELLGPAAIDVLGGSGDLLVGGEGLWTVTPGTSSTTTVVTKVTGSNGYVPPRRVSSISVVGTTNRAYIVDPTDPLVHVRSNTGKGYRVDVEGAANGEPLAVAAKPFDSSNDLLWLSFRGYQKLYLYKCPVPAGTSNTAAVTTCVFQSQALGSTVGLVDDMDGTPGGERFRQGIYGLANGLNGDLLIAEDINNAVRRHAAGRYTLTLAGGSRGYLDGSRTSAQFSSPAGMAVLPGTGDVLVVDRNNNLIRKIGCGASSICGSPLGGCPTFPVDDQVPCTADSCEGLAIRHTPLAAGASCSDNNACNGLETCTAAGVCQPGTAPTLDDNKACSADACSPSTGVSHTALAAGTPCSTNDVCRASSTCNGTSLDCPVGALLPTDDNNDCTIDACSAPVGITHVPRPSGTGCRTSTALTVNDGTCNATGACIGSNVGTPVAVDRTVPTSPGVVFGDVLASSGNGGLQGSGSSTACIQTASTPSCVFVPSHMALVRGTVADATGAGISGATISVLNHPEFGTTTTYANGEYTLVVNGGGPLTIRATAANKLPSDRLVDPPWGGTDFSADIVLIGLDPTVTPVSFVAGGLASGTPTPANTGGDTSKTRTASVFFPPNTQVSANSSTITNARFRVTEYTVGNSGVGRMPADVAANTMYTYAAEFSLEDSSGNVYDHVNFGSPVMSYVDNFIDLQVGEAVPVGYYDRQAGLWKPMPDGRVIAVDAAGAVTGIQPEDIPVSANELATLAAYKGKSIWRLPLQHFSPLDFNLGIGAPPCDTNAQGAATACPEAVSAPLKGSDDEPDCGSCTKPGSIIDVERQVLREKFPVVGTPFHLAYSSENTLGYGWNKTLSVNLEDHPKHSQLLGYTIAFSAAGRQVALGGLSKLPDGTWPKSFEKTWDGLDYQGRPVQGAAVATLDVGAVYPAVPSRVTTFGGATRARTSGSSGNAVVSAGLSGIRQDPKLTIWTKYTQNLQVWDSSALGFGGWTLSAHHAYDPVGKVLYRGDGTHRKVESVGSSTVTLVAGSGLGGRSANGTVPASANFNSIEGMAVDRDGNIYIAQPDDHVIRKITYVNGNYTSVDDYAGVFEYGALSTAVDNDEGTTALSRVFRSPASIAIHDDGRLVVGDTARRRVLEVAAGMVRTLAGRGTGGDGAPPPVGCGLFTNGVSAKLVDLCYPSAVAAGPDGSTYLLDGVSNRAYVARIDQSGRAWLVAGGVDRPFGDSYYKNLAADTHPTQMMVHFATGLGVDRNNTMWLLSSRDLVSVSTNGYVRSFSMSREGLTYSSLLDAAIFSNGDILRPSKFSGDTGRAIERCSASGKCSLIAGSLTQGNTAVGGAAVGTTFNRIDAAAVGPDDSIYAADYNSTSSSGWRVFRIAAPPVPAASSESCIHKVPSTDRSEYYCFDKNGRHQSTVDASTNGIVRTFEYFTSGDSAGLLKKVVEADGRTTEIDRSVSGSVKIKSPTDQVTTIALDSGRKLYATSISGDGSIVPNHDLNNGLLRTLQDADGQLHSFSYDNYGRLQRDADPISHQTLARTDTSGGYTVAVTTRMGKRDTFTREILADGSEQRTFGLLNGLTNVTKRDLGGNSFTTLADGTTHSSSPGADPVWGLLTPFASKWTMSAPSAAVSQTGSTVRALHVDGVSFTDTTTLTGQTTRSYTRVYNNTAKTVERTSPLNRKTKYTLDSQGRVVSAEFPGVQKIDLTINAVTGRLDKVKQGTREINLAYSSTGANKGFLTDVEDPRFTSDSATAKTIFGPDGNGRPLTSKHRNVTTLAEITTAFEWTPGGNLKSVTPPGKPKHQLGYDAAGYFKTYTPPTLGGTDEVTTFNLDLDHYLQGVDAPGWGDLAIRNDPVRGRVTGLVVGGKNIQVDYYGATGDPSCTAGCAPGRLKQITDDRAGIVTSFEWYNSLPKSISSSLANGGSAAVSWTYNNDIRVKDETVSVGGGHTSKTTLGYDLDGLLTCASLGTCETGQAEKVTVDRDATSGRVSTVTVGTSPAETLTYNAFGELRSLVSTPLSLQYEDVASTPNVLRDAQGRVKRKIEQTPAGSSPSITNYTYDEHNRLWKVQNGSNISEYGYDDNGNRISVSTPWDTLTQRNIEYNDQDQLLTYGDISFDYTPKGDVWHRYTSAGTTTYEYDALGALRTVWLPDGRRLDYLVDGRGRRVGKKVNGTLTQQWVYGQNLGPIAELDGTGAIKMRFVYASRSNVPDLVKTYPDGKLYRVYADQLGSPRVLYDIATSTSKWIGWDEFGIRQGTPSGLELPFGFAGGLYDPDTGLTRFGARDYDARIGRWVSKDPILFSGAQANLYVYVGNDPANHRDPSGLRRWSNQETDEILKDYREQIQTSTIMEKYWIMYNRHKGGGADDYWANYRYDTFCVRGQEVSSADFGNLIAGYAAGYSLDPAAHGAVRAAGSFFGWAAVMGGVYVAIFEGGSFNEIPFSLDQFIWAGDNTRSVLFIEGGTGLGLYDRLTE